MCPRIGISSYAIKPEGTAHGFPLIILVFITSLFNSSYAQDIDKDSLLAKYKEKEVLTYSKENIQLLNRLAESYRFRDPDSLLLFTKELNALSKENNDFIGIALGKMREGNYYSDIGDRKNALERYFEAEELLQGVHAPKLEIDLYTQLVIESFFSGQPGKTLESAYKGIDIAQQNDLIWHEARLRHILGFVYTQNKLYEEAEEELLNAIHLWEKTDDSLSLYGSRSNLARNSILSGDIKKAKKFFKGNIPFFGKLNETLWLARSYMVQSHILLEEKELSQALNSNKKYDSLLGKLKNPRDRILTYNLFSKLYFFTDQYDKAKQYADSTLYHALQLKDSVELLNGYESLSKMAMEKSDYGAAAKYSSLALPIKEVLDKRLRENNLKIMRTKLELEYEQVEKEIADRKRLIEQQGITVIVVLLLGVLLIILFLTGKIVRKRRRVNAELREISQTKNKLFSIIGHDLKAPINTLQELLELYDSRTISKGEISKVLPRLKENVDNSAFTLNNLLFWARTQMNGLKSNPTSVSIKEKATIVRELYRTRLDKKNIDFRCQIPNDIKVNADSVHLEIILRNIISNAIRFTAEKGQITFDCQEKDGMVEIAICDNGIGMDKSTVRQLLGNRNMEAKEGTHKEKGPGLGLQISKELIAVNNGELKVESEVGKGSCFQILLPIGHG